MKWPSFVALDRAAKDLERVMAMTTAEIRSLESFRDAADLARKHGIVVEVMPCGRRYRVDGVSFAPLPGRTILDFVRDVAAMKGAA